MAGSSDVPAGIIYIQQKVFLSIRIDK